MNQIKVYSKDGCPFCVKAKEYLKEKNLNFEEILLNDDLERKKFYEECGEGVKTVPQIFFSNKRIGGYNELINSDLIELTNLLDFDEDF